MQFYVLVVVPRTEDIVSAVTRLMEPYDLYRKVAPYKELVPEDQIEEIVTTFGVARDDLEAIVTELREESGFECGVEDGRIYWVTTDNPLGQWDSWSLRSIQDDVWPTSAVPNDRVPSAVVTPDGAWHDLGEKWKMTRDEKAALFQRADTVLDHYPEYLAVLLYCHR